MGGTDILMETEDTDSSKSSRWTAQVLLSMYGKGGLNKDQFGNLCGALFRNGDTPYEISNEGLEELFQTFDLNKDGLIDPDEFKSCHMNWIRPIVKPVSVLVIVDVQNDFISGTLALKNAPAGQEGEDVIQPINKMLETIPLPFDKVIYTKDWHPEYHISFIENVRRYPFHKSSPIQDPNDAKVLDTVIFEVDGKPVEQRLWPAHCIRDRPGSELHPKLKVVKNKDVVCKGSQLKVDSYSAFLDNDKKNSTTLKAFIDHVGAKDVYVCGLAYDICVGATAMDSLELGFRTIVLEDATRGVDLEGIRIAKSKILEMGGVITETDKVEGMVKGIDRRPELGLHLARTLRKEMLKEAGDNNNQPDKKKHRGI